MRTVASLNQAEQDKRSQELVETIRVFNREKQYWVGYRYLDKEGKLVGLNSSTGIEALDYLVEKGKTDRPLGNALFYMTVDERRELYEGLPSLPKPLYGELRIGAEIQFSLYMLLWRFEPDANLRRELLVPRLERLILALEKYPAHFTRYDFMPVDVHATLTFDRKTHTQICQTPPNPNFWDEFSETDRKERLAELCDIIEKTKVKIDVENKRQREDLEAIRRNASQPASKNTR